MNKKIIALIIILLSYGCSYEPMLSKKNYDFQFVKLTYEGEDDVNEIIEAGLKVKSKGLKKYNIHFITEKEKEIVSSDSKGDASIFRIKIDVEYDVQHNDLNVLSNSFSKYASYNNITDKFELSKYEESIIKSLSETISNEILMSIISINK